MFNFECNNHLQIKANNFLLILLIVIVAGSYSTRVTAAVCNADKKTVTVTFGDISVDSNKTEYKKTIDGNRVYVKCDHKGGHHIYVKSITGAMRKSLTSKFYVTSPTNVKFKLSLTPDGLKADDMAVNNSRGIGRGQGFSSKFYLEIGNDVKSGTVKEIIITMARLDRNNNHTGEILYEYKIPEFNVIARSCKINIPDVDVSMGAVLKNHFKNIGDTAGERSFEINVQCKGSPNANITWEPGKTGTNGVINADTTSSATGVGIQILDDKSNPVKFGEQQDLGTINSSKTLSYKAKYYQTSNTVTAGSVNATATFTVDYK
ncbi:fimbrial protein [Xenorhabdus koppenhoeferi]|uniref:Pilin (Type 1 fimbria component protein) n=1 Tax=Xenorhabdus koppenhoeferi TaxID=351659 RepID=A0A1I7JA61_9GAMM|nr:fimbrial protein [Xenorhabdus koppenhoeferi]SFU82089.1 Pilin (type 1 fimbria component protein) [Xenorhabdus koppenhoeferi]